MTTTTAGDVRAIEVIGQYFAEQTAAAQAALEKAKAALDQAEAEHQAFAERYELPPAVGGMKAGWEIASWLTSRATRAGLSNWQQEDGRAAYEEAKADRLLCFVWLESHGYEVPKAFKE
jgi:hypothetical protein